jgi:protein O-GlcNAc transferase
MNYRPFLECIQRINGTADPSSNSLSNQQLKILTQEIPGLVTPERMQLLNLAMSYLEPDEIYCEIGCYQGLSLIAALLNHPQVLGFAVDNFSELNPHDQNLEHLIRHLEKFGLEHVLVFSQDFEAFFADLHGLEIADRIGVYFYDAAQDYRSQLMSLLLVRPFLADRALIIINGSDNDFTQQAIWDFLATTPQASPLLDLPNFKHPDYLFLDGITLLAWDVDQPSTWDWQMLSQHQCPMLQESLAESAFAKRKLILSNLYHQAVKLDANHQIVEAEKKYQQFLFWESKNLQGWISLGNLYWDQQRYLEALDAFLNALELDRNQAELHLKLGITFERLGDQHRARLAYEEALTLDPKLTLASHYLGHLFLAWGEPSKAEALFRQTIAIHPEADVGYLDLGEALLAQVQIDPALAAFQTALKYNPGSLPAQAKLDLAIAAQINPSQLHAQLGTLAYNNGKYTEAIIHFQAALNRQYQEAKTANLLSSCYKHLDQIQAAIQTLEESLKIQPNSLENWLSLTFLLQDSGNTAAAIAATQKALLQFPNCFALEIQFQLLVPVIYQQQAELEHYRQRFSQGLENLLEQSHQLRLKAATTAIPPETNLSLSLSASARNLYYLAYQGQNDRHLQIQHGELFRLLSPIDYDSGRQPLPMPSLSPEGKIRVGYLAPSMGGLFIGWLRNHNHQNLEIYCYHLGTTSAELTLEFRQYSDRFYFLGNDILNIRAQILQDQLHILMFPAIGMELEILQLASQQLAPIQCTSWCHPVTTGLSSIQYFLSSELMEPEQAQTQYSEELVLLPNIGISYAQPQVPILTMTRSDFGIPDQAVVFLCCQNLTKYQPQHDYIFMEIARAVPAAKLVFLSHPIQELTKKFKQRLDLSFARYGMEAEASCLVLPRLNEGDYFQVNLLADIFLDSLGWSGGITTLKAISCDLPILTCPGKTMRSRHSYGILKMMGITETIARSEQEYIQIAIKLGLDPGWRRSILTKMQQQRPSIYEDRTCVTALEAFYCHAVQNFSGNPQ